jgi:DNA-binding IclR family transcriptional regulator
MVREQKGVEAAETVGAILHGMLQVARPARLKELEAATGIHSAKLHRYLVSMARSGLIAKHKTGSRYDFGLLAYRLGQTATHGQELLSFLEPYFENFVAELTNPDLGQAVGIGQWVGDGPTIVKWFESNSPLSIRMKPGVHLSITASATAMLLAAYRPRDITEPLVRAELLEKKTCTSNEIRRVYANYAEIRRTGIANSLGSRRAGLNALSAPLFDQTGELIAAITILGMSPSFDASLEGAAAQLLKKIAPELSLKMGHLAP